MVAFIEYVLAQIQRLMSPRLEEPSDAVLSERFVRRRDESVVAMVLAVTVASIACAAMGAVGRVEGRAPPNANGTSRSSAQPTPTAQAKGKTDAMGDPLPEGVLSRIGTVRGRLPGLATACVFSRDGKTLVAAGGDAAIHLFESATLRPLRQLRQHKKTVTCLAFAPDGKTLVSGSEDGTLCFWEWPSGKVQRPFPAHEGGVRVMAFAGTGKFVASGGEDKRVRLWDAATGRELRQYEGHKDIVTGLAVSPDGRFVASSSQSFSHKVHLWDAANGRLLRQQKSKAHWVGALAFSPDSKLIAIPSDVLNVSLIDVVSGKIVRELISKGNCDPSALAFSADGRNVAAVSQAYNLALWDASTGKLLHQLPRRQYVRFPGGITCLAFAPDGSRFAIGADHCLRAWDLPAWREVPPLEGHTNRIYRVLFSPDNKTLIAAADEVTDSVQEWDAATGKKLRTLWREHLLGGNGFHIAPDRSEITVAETEERGLLLRCQNPATDKELRRNTLPFNGEYGYHPAAFVFSPNGKIITTESRNEKGMLGPILLRDTTTGKELGKLPDRLDWFLFSPDSSVLACARRGRMDLYHVPTGRIAWKLPFADENYYPRSSVFSTDSRLMAAASTNSDDARAGRIDIWETATGKKRAAQIVGRASLLALAFSPDGGLLAAGDDNGTIHLWSMASGKEVRQLLGHRGRIDSLAFAHDGTSLASGSWDTTALIWDIGEAAEVARPRLADVSKERLEQMWTDLADDNGERVHRAVWSLTASRQLVPWLRERLKPVAPLDARRVGQSIVDLDSDTFAVREKATRELEEMGEAAEPALRKALADKPTLEVRRRIEPMVKDLERWPSTSPSTLRAWHALEVLEHLGTPEAQRLLQELAGGTPEARLTREATASLKRIKGRTGMNARKDSADE